MLYLKNSLVNLTIIFFSLFFLTISSAENNNFIFPKKKIITVIMDEKKENIDVLSRNFISIKLPQRNPLRKNSTKQKKKNNIVKSAEVTKKKKTLIIEELPTFLRKNLSLKIILKFKKRLSLFLKM